MAEKDFLSGKIGGGRKNLKLACYGYNLMAHRLMQTVRSAEVLGDVVARVLRAVRSFGKVRSETLSTDIQFLRDYLTNRNEGDILGSTSELQAASLIFDYEDSRGGPFTLVVHRVGEAILRNKDTRIQEMFRTLQGSGTHTKWMRQVVWVLLAQALWLHRRNKLDRMGLVLTAAKELLDHNLAPETERPGTLSRWHYYRGLQMRDQGDLESAMEHFRESFHHAQERRSAKVARLKAAPVAQEDFDVEEAFTRACLARIQAFGFGEVSFFRGDLAGSSAWFKTALMTLEGEGLERWKYSVRVYLGGSTILISQFTAEGANKVKASKDTLTDLAGSLEKLHGGYANLASAFANLGQVRLEQMRSVERDPNTEALQVNLSLDKASIHPEPMLPNKSVPSVSSIGPHGAISALISLISGEVLLRCHMTNECFKEIGWIRSHFRANTFAQSEADLLEAQLYMVEGEWKKAARILEKDRNLDHRANRNQRALWFALSSIVQHSLNNSLSAGIFAHRARAVGRSVSHGFVKHLVNVAVARALPESARLFPMPYQEEPPNLSLEDNEQAWINNLIETALSLDDSIKSAEELAPHLKVAPATVYSRIDKKLLEKFFKKKLNMKLGA